MNKEYKPLVSVIIPNYNHSMYLDQSIQSALNQTYPNIEVIVNDNCSTDCSVKVIRKYIPQGVIVNKNPENILNSNYRVVYERSHGKYFLLLCADDVLYHDFIEKAVKIMEEHENIGLVHGERRYIDENGNITELDPFFNCSFMAKGENMLPIFMLTDVGQSAQGLIRRSSFEQAGYHDTEHDHTNIDKEQWFRLCMECDYAYLQDLAANIRVPSNISQTSITVNSFYHPIALYVTLKGFIHWGRLRNYLEVVEREEKGMRKLANECMAMTRNLLANGKYDLARQYLLFMGIADSAIMETEEYGELLFLWKDRNGVSDTATEYGKTSSFAFHKRSYDPPKDFLPLMEV